MMTNGRNMVLCPKCKIPMEYTLETEKSSNGVRRLIRYYKCLACGTRIIDEVIIINPNGKLIQLSIQDQKRTIIAKVQSSRKRRRK